MCKPCAWIKPRLRQEPSRGAAGFFVHVHKTRARHLASSEVIGTRYLVLTSGYNLLRWRAEVRSRRLTRMKA